MSNFTTALMSKNLKRFLDEQKREFERKEGVKIPIAKFQDMNILPPLRNAIFNAKFEVKNDKKRKHN
jgi:hypothetical protein